MTTLINIPLKYAGIGSRTTPADICSLIIEIAAELSRNGWILRSGAALGADAAFETGHRRSDAEGARAEIYLPIADYNGHASQRLPSEPAFELAKRFAYRFPKRSAFAQAAHARNMMQILGENLDDPVDLVVCWTKDGKDSGGTGSALRCAAAFDIPILNLGDPSVPLIATVILEWISNTITQRGLTPELAAPIGTGDQALDQGGTHE